VAALVSKPASRLARQRIAIVSRVLALKRSAGERMLERATSMPTGVEILGLRCGLASGR